MADLNRERVLACLEALGAEDDQAVLATARDLHAQVTQSGATWDQLLRPENEPEEFAEPPEEFAEPEDEVAADDEAAGADDDAIEDDDAEDTAEAQDAANDDDDPEEDEAEEDEPEEDEPEEDEAAEVEAEADEPEEDEPEEDEPEEDDDTAGPTPTRVGGGDDLAIINALLRRSKLYEGTRAELQDFKQDIKAGEFTAEDKKYLRSLAARLGVKIR